MSYNVHCIQHFECVYVIAFNKVDDCIICMIVPTVLVQYMSVYT